ncbi:hypothetical protein HZA76_00945 [Candidatus Roizmanbacteria bacterium]|nr:hypothetical protein [Candidatus Roizmanbacteria bacterium]
MAKTLRVGFDLDGVILYNPIRILRPFAKNFLKPIKAAFFHQEKSLFYLPQSNFEKLLWKIIHWTSFKPNKGLEDLRKLAKNRKIKFYLITGRYDFLANDYFQWLKKIDAKKIFTQCFYNSKNLQPNVFKENMIKKLKLDIYVEDNFDIIEKLNHQSAGWRTKILWLTNIMDKNIPYQFKFFTLKEVYLYLKTLV